MFNRLVALVSLLSIVISGLAGSSGIASARADGQFPVFAIACDAFVTAPGSASGAGLPPECSGIEGMRIEAFSTNSEPLDDCETNAEGFCLLAIDFNGTRIFRQDVNAVPDGYVSLEPVQKTFTYTEFGEIWFYSYREDVLPQRDAPRATVRVNTRVCPDKYSGDTFFEDCDPTLPEFDQWVFANDQVARAGEDGNAILRNVPAATESVISSGYDLTTGDIFFYCSLTSDPSVRVPTELRLVAQYDGVSRDFTGVVDLEPGMDITCDWYQIPSLDRGLWDTLNNPMSGDDPNITYPAPFGEIGIVLKRCPEGFTPDTISNATATCTEREYYATVRATSEEGVEHDSAKTNDEGMATLSLSDKPVKSFWISLDGHENAMPDMVVCNANYTQYGPGIQQWVTFDGAASWTIDGFGDDFLYPVCTWYLVPTGS